MSFGARQTSLATQATYGAALPDNLYIYDTSIFQAIATFDVYSTGTYASTANSSDPSGTWLLSGIGSDYEINFIVTSGGVNNGIDPVNTWLSLGTSRSWSVLANPGGGIYYNSVQAFGFLQIREASSAVIVATSKINLLAVSTNF